MGRGLGPLQRQVLELVEAEGGWTYRSRVLYRLFGPDHTESQRRSLNRAFYTLRDRGEVELDWHIIRLIRSGSTHR